MLTALHIDPVQLREKKTQFLLSTHVPKCVDPDSYPLGIVTPFCSAGMMPDWEDIITRDKVKLAISIFEPFKSPGPDGIFPDLLQYSGDIYILERASHIAPKVYRLISLSPFLIKAYIKGK